MPRIVLIVLLCVTTLHGALGGEEAIVNDTRAIGIALNERTVFKNWGVGGLTCVTYLEARKFPDSSVGPYDATFRQWLLGFATAFNVKDPGTSDLLGNTTVEKTMAWLEYYCRKHRNAEFFDAVWAFTKKAYPRRKKLRNVLD